MNLRHTCSSFLSAFVICASLAITAGCTEKDPASAKEPPNIYQSAVHYNPDRPKADLDADDQRRPAEILAFAGVKPGMKVIDLMGGGGWYTELLADVVGDQGHVYLVNSPLFVKFTQAQIETRLAKNRLKNVTRIDSEWADMQLPDDVDMIWLSLAYHDIYVPRPEEPTFEADRDVFFRQIFTALKPGGFLLLIDHAATQGTDASAAQELHRIDEEFAKKDFQKAGFELVNSIDILRNPNDDRTKNIWDKSVINKTDKFVLLLQKPPLTAE